MRQDWILKPFLLGAVCFATSTTARSSNSPELFQRASTCADSSFTKCSQAGLPSNFCCGPSTVCIPLAANTTVLCCPNGEDCSSIAPITCDITQQNATLHPNNALKTTALTSTLATCGSQCCPFGFSCIDSVCMINSDQSAAPPSNSTNSSATSTSIATSTAPFTKSTLISPPTITSSSQTNDTSTLPIEESCDKFPAGAVLAGFFPGIILGILLTVASVCFLGARRRKAARRSGSSFGNISEPQLSSDIRTDFLRKRPQTPSTLVGSTPPRQPSLHRVKSLFRMSASTNRSASPVPPIPLNLQRPQGAQRPGSLRMQREPSYEDINIFADGDTANALRERQAARRDSQQTTFSDMMERSGLAGLQKGQPYVYRGNSTERQSPLRNPGARGKEI